MGPVTDCRIVLVRPRNPLNIGAVARALGNFGLKDLVVVRPYPPVWREAVSAVGAEQLLKAARVTRTLDEAVSDCATVLGTTTLRDRRVERPLVRLNELHPYLQSRGTPGRTALVFGPEKTGLAGRHLERCHAWVTVPTSADCPSMNLGQAVAVCVYEWSRGAKGLGPQEVPESPPLVGEDFARLTAHVDETFQAAGYLTFLPGKDRREKIRRTLLGWRLQRRDARILHGFCRQVEGRLKLR